MGCNILSLFSGCIRELVGLLINYLPWSLLMSRCQCRIREAKDHPSRPISWSYFLVPSHQRCMSNMPSRNKHSPRCNLKLAHWKLVKADWHTAAIVHQSVTKVELCQYPKCAIKLKYLCDNLKTKSPSPIIKCTLKIAYLVSTRKAGIQLWVRTRNTYWWWIRRCWKCIQRPSKW